MKFNYEIPDLEDDEPKLNGRKVVLIEKDLEDDLNKLPAKAFLRATRDFWRALNENHKKKKKAS